jgi:hypothetical protein
MTCLRLRLSSCCYASICVLVARALPARTTLRGRGFRGASAFRSHLAGNSRCPRNPADRAGAAMNAGSGHSWRYGPSHPQQRDFCTASRIDKTSGTNSRASSDLSAVT